MIKLNYLIIPVVAIVAALAGRLTSSPSAPPRKPATADLASSTQTPKVDVNRIGVHSVIEIGDHDHGKLTAEQWMKETEAHDKAKAEIFFQPGGRYTKEDIERNGPLSPAKEYAGIPSRHDLKTKKGDPVCPITETLANASFPWWIGGKKHLFCCPPCIEEFVMIAKRNPSDIMPPEAYVKK